MSAHHDAGPKPYGVVAAFRSPEDLLSATNSARQAGYSKMDAYTPIPVEGLTEALDFKDDRLFWVTLLGGFAGAATGLWLEWWTSNYAYAHNTGGITERRPPPRTHIAHASARGWQMGNGWQRT